MTEKVKERALTALAIVGMIAAGIIFWELVRAFMWMCYEAGIPM